MIEVEYLVEGEDPPENFLTPRRFPGEPPLLRTDPPARLVAVRMEPVIGQSWTVRGKGQEQE